MPNSYQYIEKKKSISPFLQKLKRVKNLKYSLKNYLPLCNFLQGNKNLLLPLCNFLQGNKNLFLPLCNFLQGNKNLFLPLCNFLQGNKKIFCLIVNFHKAIKIILKKRGK